jgi:hypothetical protein
MTQPTIGAETAAMLHRMLAGKPLSRKQVVEMISHFKLPGQRLAEYLAAQVAEIRSPLNVVGTAEEFHEPKPPRQHLCEHFIHVGAAERFELQYFLFGFLRQLSGYDQQRLQTLETQEIHSDLNRLGSAEEYQTDHPTEEQLKLHYISTGGEIRLFIKLILELVNVQGT